MDLLTVNASDLELEVVADLLEVGLGGDLGQADVHRGTDSGA